MDTTPMRDESGQILTDDRGAESKPGLRSVGLMKTLCPTCMAIGLVMLPFELVGRLAVRLIGSG